LIITIIYIAPASLPGYFNNIPGVIKNIFDTSFSFSWHLRCVAQPALSEAEVFIFLFFVQQLRTI
jgi:hypothetical protein